MGQANLCLCGEVPHLPQSLIRISLLSDTYLFFSTAILPPRESRWHQQCPLWTAQHKVPIVLSLKKKKKKSKGKLNSTVSLKTSFTEVERPSPVLSVCIVSGDTSMLMVSDSSCRPLMISCPFSYPNFSHRVDFPNCLWDCPSFHRGFSIQMFDLLLDDHIPQIRLIFVCLRSTSLACLPGSKSLGGPASVLVERTCHFHLLSPHSHTTLMRCWEEEQLTFVF